MERARLRDPALNAPRRACVRGGRSKDDMTLRQGLLAARLALAMINLLDVRGAVGMVGSPGAVNRAADGETATSRPRAFRDDTRSKQR